MNNTYNPQGGKLYDENGNIVYLSDLFNSIQLKLEELKGSIENNKITENTEITIYQKRHQEIHKGNYYTISLIVTIPASDSINFGFVTGALNIHLTPPVIKTSKEDVEFYGYEDSIYSGGSPITVQNNNLTSSNTTTITNIKSGVTASTRGNLKYTDFIPGSTGIGGRNNGGSLVETQEWILKPSKIYTFEIINGSSDANKCHILLGWYESDE